MLRLGTRKINQQKEYLWCIYYINVLFSFNNKTSREEQKISLKE